MCAVVAVVIIFLIARLNTTSISVFARLMNSQVHFTFEFYIHPFHSIRQFFFVSRNSILSVYSGTVGAREQKTVCVHFPMDKRMSACLMSSSTRLFASFQLSHIVDKFCFFFYHGNPTFLTYAEDEMNTSVCTRTHSQAAHWRIAIDRRDFVYFIAVTLS